MRIICGWCTKFLGEKEPLGDKRETHGICPSCEKRITEDYLRKRKEVR